MMTMMKQVTRLGAVALASAVAFVAVPSSTEAQIFPGEGRHGGSAGWWNLAPFAVDHEENEEMGARITTIPEGVGVTAPNVDGLLYTYDSRSGEFTVVDFSGVQLDPRGRAFGNVTIQVVNFAVNPDTGLVEMVEVTPRAERAVKGRLRFVERWDRDFRGLADQRGNGILERRVRHRMNLIARGQGQRTRLRGAANLNTNSVNDVASFNTRLNTRVVRQGQTNVRARSTVVITGLQQRVDAEANAPFDAFHFNIDPETFRNRGSSTRRFIGTATMRSVHFPRALGNGNGEEENGNGGDEVLLRDNGDENGEQIDIDVLSAWQANPGTVRVGFRRYANPNTNAAGNYRITYRSRVGRVWHRIGQRGLTLATPQDQMAQALEGDFEPMYLSFFDRAFNASTPASSTKIMSRRSRNDVNLTNVQLPQ